MRDGLVKVDRYVREVLDGQLVVRRPGDRVDTELAVRLGLTAPGAPPERRLPANAFLPEAWRASA
jgi:hypothetical protein